MLLWRFGGSILLKPASRAEIKYAFATRSGLDTFPAFDFKKSARITGARAKIFVSWSMTPNSDAHATSCSGHSWRQMSRSSDTFGRPYTVKTYTDNSGTSGLCRLPIAFQNGY